MQSISKEARTSNINSLWNTNIALACFFVSQSHELDPIVSFNSICTPLSLSLSLSLSHPPNLSLSLSLSLSLWISPPPPPSFLLRRSLSHPLSIRVDGHCYRLCYEVYATRKPALRREWRSGSIDFLIRMMATLESFAMAVKHPAAAAAFSHLVCICAYIMQCRRTVTDGGG